MSNCSIKHTYIVMLFDATYLRKYFPSLIIFSDLLGHKYVIRQEKYFHIFLDDVNIFVILIIGHFINML